VEPVVEIKPQVVTEVVHKKVSIQIPEPELCIVVPTPLPIIPTPLPFVEIDQEPEPVFVKTFSEKVIKIKNSRNRLRPRPVRESQLPVAGERGLQPRYSNDQKREMFLSKLSRKSVKRAEQEVNAINDVLVAAEHCPEKLRQEETILKHRLKLINNAKFFAIDNNINDPKNGKPQEPDSTDMSDTPK